MEDVIYLRTPNRRNSKHRAAAAPLRRGAEDSNDEDWPSMSEKIKKVARHLTPLTALILFAESAAATFAAVFDYDLLAGRSAPVYAATAILCLLLAPKVESLWAHLERRSRVIVMVLAVAYAVGWCVGATYAYADAFEVAAGRKVLLVLHFACSIVLFRGMILVALGLAEKIRSEAPDERLEGERALLGVFTAVIVAGAALYTIAYYPGVSFWDGQRQLNEIFGLQPLTNHHPILSTAIIGACQWVGRTLVDDNFGMFLYNMLVTGFSIVVFRKVARLQFDVRAPRWLVIATGCFFAFLPIIRLYSLTICKDTSYAICLLWLVVLLYKLYLARVRQEDLRLGRSFAAQMVVCLVLLCLLRNDGTYVVLFTLVGVLVFCLMQRDRRAAGLTAGLAAGVVALHLAMGVLVLPALGVKAGNPGEALSVPIQQVALTLQSYPDDVTEQERQTIQRCFGISPEEMASHYDPNISDPVKNYFLSDETTGTTGEFLGTWAAMLRRHPVTFVKAYVNGYWGYFYPAAFGDEPGFTTFEPNKTINTGYFDHHHLDATAPLRGWLDGAADYVRATPIASLLYCPGFYLWTLAFCIAAALMRRRYSSLVMLLPLVATAGIVCLSPVNCRIRYVLPLVLCLPVMVTLLVGKVRVARECKARSTDEKSEGEAARDA